MIKTPSKKNVIYILVFVAFIVLASFSGGEYMNIRKERNTLKTSLKETEEKYKELDIKYSNSLDNEDSDVQTQYNYERDYYREKKLRLKYEKVINIFVNYDNRTADSIISNYKFTGEL